MFHCCYGRHNLHLWPLGRGTTCHINLVVAPVELKMAPCQIHSTASADRPCMARSCPPNARANSNWPFSGVPIEGNVTWRTQFQTSTWGWLCGFPGSWDHSALGLGTTRGGKAVTSPDEHRSSINLWA